LALSPFKSNFFLEFLLFSVFKAPVRETMLGGILEFIRVAAQVASEKWRYFNIFSLMRKSFYFAFQMFDIHAK